ncbi:MAG: alpha/beta fold hydrolase [Myxococcales bacterium]|nr:alpha/beta fold hydrolase [Myxococcales bacterium]
MLRIQYVKRGNHRIAFSLRGEPSSAPLLMIRGLARTSRHWGRIVGELEQRFRLVLIDNRGVGKSDVPLRPFTTADMADDAATVLDTLGLEQSNVLGISLGGMIAQELALRHPERVRRLVLGCTRAGGGTGKSVPWRTALELVRVMRLPAERAIRESAKLILSRDFLDQHPEVLDEWLEIARQSPPSRRGVIFQLLAAARHDTSQRISGLRVPTLLITGDADRLLDAENSRYLSRKIPGARLEFLPGAGHDFPTERATETAALLATFCLDA